MATGLALPAPNPPCIEREYIQFCCDNDCDSDHAVNVAFAIETLVVFEPATP